MPCYARPLLLVMGLCLRGVVPGQENPARLDSILPLLDRAKKDTLQLTMLIWSAESWATSNKAIPYLGRLDTLSSELLLHPSAAVRKRARHARGAFHFFTGYHAKFERNIPLALSSFKAAIVDFSADGHQHAVGQCHDALGILFRVAGLPREAERAFQEELQIARSIRHNKLGTQALVHLAACAVDRGDFASSNTYLDLCRGGDQEDSSAVLTERAHLLLMEKQPAQAIEVLLRSLKVASRSDNPWDQLPVLAPLARTLYTEGRYAEGLRYAQQCASIANDMGDETARCGCVVLMGKGERALDDYVNAEMHLKEGLRLARENGDVGVAREMGDEGSMLHAAEQLKELYREQGNTSEALAMTDLWSLLKDSVEHMNGREELAGMELRERLLVDSIAFDNKLMRASAQHERSMARERTRRNLLLALGAVLLTIAIAIWSRMRLVRRTNAAILAAQEKLISSEKHRAAEQVRTGIARDVHDQLGSDLTKLVMLGGEVKALASGGSASIVGTADDIERIAGEANRSLSDIVWAVDPQQDSMVGLMDRSRLYCERMLHKSGIAHSIECAVEGRDRPIDPATKRDLYLALREALNNALKYAHAQHIEVRFTSREGRVRLHVRDDGRGFNTIQALRNGNGLRNLKVRADRLGADLVIASEPGGGTLIRLDTELPEPVSEPERWMER